MNKRPIDETRNDESNDVHWLAFRYLAEEMDADQTEWFESLMAEDQAAREALASAVELTDTLVATEKIAAPVRQSRQTSVHAFWWMTVGAALCLAVMLASKAIWPAATPRNVARQKPIDISSLAIAWEKTRAMLTEETELPSIDGLLEEDESDVELSDLTGGVFEGDPMAPSWMESALLGVSPGDDEEEEWEG